jgi:hypothetical protein
MDSKTQVAVNATPATDALDTKVDAPPVTVTTTSVPENVTTSVAISNDTEWKITIHNRDGTKSEVMLSPVSTANPTRQDIRIVMPGAQVQEELDGPESEKNPKKEEVRNINQHATLCVRILINLFNRLPKTRAKCEFTLSFNRH